MRRRLIFALLAGCLPTLASAQEIKLKLAFFPPETESVWQTILKPFVEAVNRDGHGVVQIEPFLSGTLGRSVLAQPQMVLDGVADMAFIIPGATPGRFANHSLLEMPGLFQSIREGSRVYTNLVNDGTLRGYEGYKLLIGITAPPYSLHSRKPLQQLSDLKGMKLRTANETDRAILSALGAVPVLLPVNEGVEAIARGTVDGTELNTLPFIDFGYNRVTKYDYYLELGRAGTAVIMNRQKFEALPAAGKAVIEKYSGEWLIDRADGDLGSKNDQVLAQLKADPARVSTTPSVADQKTADAVFASVMDTWITKDPIFPETAAKIREAVAKARATSPQ